MVFLLQSSLTSSWCFPPHSPFIPRMTVQTSTMKTCFQRAECNLSFCKDNTKKRKSLHEFLLFLGDLFSCHRAILFFPFAFAWAATRAMRPYVYARAKDRHSPITKRKSLRGTIPQRLFILSDKVYSPIILLNSSSDTLFLFSVTTPLRASTSLASMARSTNCCCASFFLSNSSA